MLGPVDQLADAVQAYGVERVIIALPATEHRNIADIIEQCKAQRVGFYVVPDLFEIQLNTVDIDSIGGIPIIGFKGRRHCWLEFLPEAPARQHCFCRRAHLG